MSIVSCITSALGMNMDSSTAAVDPANTDGNVPAPAGLIETLRNDINDAVKAAEDSVASWKVTVAAEAEARKLKDEAEAALAAVKAKYETTRQLIDADITTVEGEIKRIFEKL